MSTSRIQVLDELTADQIAAGEVVERPGSVVKELIENSLDSGATRIQLDIVAGGVSRIRVLDNGSGISPDEIELAFQRHATSKIRGLDDLNEVATHGFRGEALPSIASVSKVTVRTRTKDAVAGTMLRLEGGKVTKRQEVGCPVGTEVEVQDLFYNTPARLKFLKRESTEAGHAGEALVRLAAFRPDVAFTMTSGGRRIRDLPRVEKTEERIGYMFGGETLVRSHGSENGVEVFSILGPPERARAGAGSLYTYVNGRFMRDKVLLRAVTQAFAGTLERGRYPVGVIALALPLGSFDINVHPQKTEIRFADPQAVLRAVVRVVGEMVKRAAWAAEPSGAVKVADAGNEMEPTKKPYRPTGRLVPPPSDFAKASSRSSSGFSDSRASGHGGDSSDVFTSEKKSFSDLTYIGQAKGLFLLLESEDDLVFIDQHAAHERIIYEHLRAQLTNGRIATQQLLIPHNVDLGPADTQRIVGMEKELGRLGLEVIQSGLDRITIHAMPAELSDASPDRLLADMTLAIEQGREGSRGELEDKVLATMACHGSLRSGRTVNPAEAEALLHQMDKVDFAGHCPHGRPVLARIPWREIRRRVGRN
ncbi:MAG: DNA mismatch repair endonuclease MutL [Proteobacteria bacterium]|nr:DNA mismatch repair endonuclease MutL [Pseudomonadota bacterium]